MKCCMSSFIFSSSVCYLQWLKISLDSAVPLPESNLKLHQSASVQSQSFWFHCIWVYSLIKLKPGRCAKNDPHKK